MQARWQAGLAEKSKCCGNEDLLSMGRDARHISTDRYTCGRRTRAGKQTRPGVAQGLPYWTRPCVQVRRSGQLVRRLI